MQTFSVALPFRALHLMIVGQAPVQEGPFGSECRWVHDAGAYRNARHSWDPNGGDAAYAAWQSGDLHGDEEDQQWVEGDPAPALLPSETDERRANRTGYIPPGFYDVYPTDEDDIRF